MTKKKRDSCMSGYDIINYAARQPGVIVIQGHGRHKKIKTKRGTVICPDDRKDMHPGLRKNIFKQLAMIGVTALVLGAAIAFLL